MDGNERRGTRDCFCVYGCNAEKKHFSKSKLGERLITTLGNRGARTTDFCWRRKEWRRERPAAVAGRNSLSLGWDGLVFPGPTHSCLSLSLSLSFAPLGPAPTLPIVSSPNRCVGPPSVLPRGPAWDPAWNHTHRRAIPPARKPESTEFCSLRE